MGGCGGDACPCAAVPSCELLLDLEFPVLSFLDFSIEFIDGTLTVSGDLVVIILWDNRLDNLIKQIWILNFFSHLRILFIIIIRLLKLHHECRNVAKDNSIIRKKIISFLNRIKKICLDAYFYLFFNNNTMTLSVIMMYVK